MGALDLFVKRTPKAEERDTTDAERRAKILPEHELPVWAETCIFQIGRSLVEYRREPDLVYLAEARLAVDTLQVLLQEMELRRGT